MPPVEAAAWVGVPTISRFFGISIRRLREARSPRRLSLWGQSLANTRSIFLCARSRRVAAPAGSFQTDPVTGEAVIRTPDRRLRVFVGSALDELAEERRAVSLAKRFDELRSGRGAQSAGGGGRGPFGRARKDALTLTSGAPG
jgi:hypothetical protein